MKHIRIIALSLSLVLMLGLFAACGKGGSESSSGSQSSAGTSQSDADASSSATVTPDASQPQEETPAPEETPEEKPQTPAPEAKPEQKPETPAPEVKPDEAPAPEQAPAAVDLTAFYETIFTDPENTPALVPMENDALDAFFPGLTALSPKQLVAYMPMMTAVPCEIVMVECASAADAETVKDIFKARIDSQINNQFNYPLVIEAWEKEAKIVSNGNFVALFVISGMTEQVASSFNALF